MRKEELVYLFNKLNNEDSVGQITAIVYDANDGQFITDSIRLDMDGGRLIIAQKGCNNYERNKKNWKQELEFYK